MARSPLAWWADVRNGWDFALRNRWTWSPRARERADGAGTDDPREPLWVDRYALEPSRQRMTDARWRRNLAVIEVLEAALGRLGLPHLGEPGAALRVLDIGSKNFDYVDGLYGFWSSVGGPRPVRLTGLEVDAHRRYTDFRTRRAWAEHYCSFVPGARYLAGDLEVHHDRYHAITWFFPFVTEFPLVRWGLPIRLFRPQVLFDHACELLEPGGVMVIVNLNQAEARVQHGLIRRRGRTFEDLGPVPSTFGSGARDQRLTVVRG